MLRTRAPVYSPCGFLPRLACVRHAASVRSEPGSNSPINLQLKRFWFGCSRNLAHTPLAKRTRGPLKVLAVPRNFFVVLLSSFQRPRTLAPSLRASDRLYPSCLLPCPCLLPCSTPPCRRPTAFRAARLPGVSPFFAFQGARFLPRLPTPRQALSCRPASLLVSLSRRADATASTPRLASPQGSGVLANSSGAVNSAAAARSAPRDRPGRPPCCAGPRWPLASPP